MNKERQLVKKLKDLGYKYCRGCEEIHALDQFYVSRGTYTSSCKTKHKEGLKKTRELQSAGLKHKPFKQLKMF